MEDVAIVGVGGVGTAALQGAVYGGGLQIALLRPWQQDRPGLSVAAVLMLVIWGVAVFGTAMDRYVASFMPNAERLPIIAILAIGTVPFMVADAYVTGGGEGALWRRAAARGDPDIAGWGRRARSRAADVRLHHPAGAFAVLFGPWPDGPLDRAAGWSIVSRYRARSLPGMGAWRQLSPVQCKPIGQSTVPNDQQ